MLPVFEMLPVWHTIRGIAFYFLVLVFGSIFRNVHYVKPNRRDLLCIWLLVWMEHHHRRVLAAVLPVFPILRIHGAYSPDVSTSTSLFRWRTKIVLTTLACHKGCFGRRGPRPMAAAMLGAIVRHSKPGDAGRGGSGFANRKRSCWLR